MVAHVRTNRVFSGRMYGRSRPNSCVVDVERSLDFELKLGYNDIDCDVAKDSGGKFSSEVIIQVIHFSVKSNLLLTNISYTAKRCCDLLVNKHYFNLAPRYDYYKLRCWLTNSLQLQSC